MSRIDTINRALEAHLFINLHNRPDDETLRQRFAALPDDEQQQLIATATPNPCHPEEIDPDILADAARVAQHYAYRLLGSEQLPPFLRRAMIMADDSDSADVLLLSALTAASACLPNLRGSLLDEEEPDLDSPDLLNDSQRTLWNALPKNFIKKEAIQIAMENGIQLRTMERYLAVFLEIGILKSSRRGYYTKTE